MTSQDFPPGEGGDAQMSSPLDAPEGPSDPRQYARISVDLPGNLKIQSMSEPLVAIAASVIAICLSAASFTDGHVPINALRNNGISEVIIKEMIQEGLWHDQNHSCKRCLSRSERPTAGRIYIHDYMFHQRSAAVAKDLSAKRARAGAEGGRNRWAKERAQKAAAAEAAGTIPAAVGGAEPAQETIATPAKPPAKEKGKATTKPLSAEKAETIANAEVLCNYLADLMQKNHSRGDRPKMGKEWVNDMRKMMEIDSFTREQLGRLIRWTQRDTFWSGNIKSPAKLREKQAEWDLYGKMLRAEGELPEIGEKAGSQSSATKALTLAARLREEEEAEEQKGIAA